jgi:hypothetical protein
MVDLGPMPDLSTYDALPDDAYEWLLSDHPWARTERIRRRAAATGAKLDNASRVRDWTDRISEADLQQRYANEPAFARNLDELAELMRPRADRQQLRTHLDDAEPDELRVLRLRQNLVTHRHVRGDDTYEYPAHLIGPSAAAYPPPASGFSQHS